MTNGVAQNFGGGGSGGGVTTQDVTNLINSNNTNFVAPADQNLQNQINDKANINDVYNKTQTDNLLNNKANTTDLNNLQTDLNTNYYNKTQTDNLLNNKANINDLNNLQTNLNTNYYNKNQTDTFLNNKTNQTDFNNLQTNLNNNYYTKNNLSVDGNVNLNVNGTETKFLKVTNGLNNNLNARGYNIQDIGQTTYRNLTVSPSPTTNEAQIFYLNGDVFAQKPNGTTYKITENYLKSSDYKSNSIFLNSLGGTNDNSTQINNALVQAKTEKKDVILLPGDYYIENPIILQNSVNIKGFGENTKIRTNLNLTNILTTNNLAVKANYYDFDIVLNELSGATSHDIIVDLTRSLKCNFFNVNIIAQTSTFNKGFRVRMIDPNDGFGAFYNTFFNCRVTKRINSGLVVGDEIGFSFENSGNSNCLYACTFSGIATPIKEDGDVNANNYQAITLENFKKGFWLNGSNAASIVVSRAESPNSNFETIVYLENTYTVNSKNGKDHQIELNFVSTFNNNGILNAPLPSEQNLINSSYFLISTNQGKKLSFDTAEINNFKKSYSMNNFSTRDNQLVNFSNLTANESNVTLNRSLFYDNVKNNLIFRNNTGVFENISHLFSRETNRLTETYTWNSSGTTDVITVGNTVNDDTVGQNLSAVFFTTFPLPAGAATRATLPVQSNWTNKYLNYPTLFLKDETLGAFYHDPTTTNYYDFEIDLRVTGSFQSGANTTYFFYLRRPNGQTAPVGAITPLSNDLVKVNNFDPTIYTTTLKSRIFTGGNDNFQTGGTLGPNARGYQLFCRTSDTSLTTFIRITNFSMIIKKL